MLEKREVLMLVILIRRALHDTCRNLEPRKGEKVLGPEKQCPVCEVYAPKE